ncbi:MAG: DUF885 domain-containing protein, partial [Vallitaleaceae bacterium]|nr:DUF885 domain-containing protein [Vallitaleaceae bacterium]
MKNQKLRLISLLLILALLLSACKKEVIIDEPADITDDVEVTDSGPEPTELPEEIVYDEGIQSSFDAFAEEFALESIAASPIDATFKYGDLEEIGLGDLLSQMDDFTFEASEAYVDNIKEELLNLESYDYDSLTKDRQITYDMMAFHMNDAINSEEFYYYFTQFEPTSGIQVYLPITLMQIEFDKESEIAPYLERLRQVPRYIDQTIAYTYSQADLGLLMPASMYDLVITQINDMLGEPESFMMYLSFVDRVDALNLDADISDAYKAECLSIITDDIYPVYEEIIIAMEDIKQYATTDNGISTWDNKDAFYTYLIKSKTSYDMTIDEYRRFLVEQSMAYSTKIQAITAEHPEILEMDLTTLLPSYESIDDVYAYQQIALDAEFYDYGIENASENVIPSYLEDYLAAGFYFPLTIDGEDYGNMYLTADAYDTVDASTLELYFHENMPGHHMYFAKLYGSELPLIRKALSWLPFEEGWATYVQGKAYEYIELEDYVSELMYYVSMMSLYNGAVMDLYIHVDGITYTQAVEIYVSMGYPEDLAKESVNRLLCNPGEYIHYTYGYYKISNYKEQCMEELGDLFDIKSFHDMILSYGSVPFATMDGLVN